MANIRNTSIEKRVCAYTCSCGASLQMELGFTLGQCLFALCSNFNAMAFLGAARKRIELKIGSLGFYPAQVYLFAQHFYQS